MERLALEQTALLFFDFLNGHVKNKDGSIKERYIPVLANAVALMETARSSGVLIAYAAANHRPDNGTSANTTTDTDMRLNLLPPDRSNRKFAPGVYAGSWEAQVVDELKPQPEDYLVPKFRWNAFYQTYLDLALRNRGVNTIIISGGSTDVGVASTAYAARDMDYNLVIVSDACVSAEADNHDQFMNRIFPRMARVRTTERVLQMISEASD